MYILYVTMVSGLRAYVQVRARVMKGHSAFTPPRLFLAWYLNLTVMYPLSLWHWRFRSVRGLLAFLWFSYGCPMVFPLVSYGFPMVFLWFSFGFLWFSHRFSYTVVFLKFSYGCPMVFLFVFL